MEIKGMRPISVENVPDGQIMFQAAFRKGDKVYNVNVIGDVQSLIASAKLRDLVMVKGFFNAAILNAAAVFDMQVDCGIGGAPELLVDGEVAALAASEGSRIIKP